MHTLNIPDGVKYIDDLAFGHCFNLTSVTMPNSVVNIGELAFNTCNSLTSITIPSGVTNIGDGVFYHCSSLKDIYALPITAPACDLELCHDYMYIDVTLHIPAGSEDSYISTSPWNKFKNIQSNATGIKNIREDKGDESKNAPVYNLQGVKMQNTDNLPKGIYIKNGKKYHVK